MHECAAVGAETDESAASLRIRAVLQQPRLRLPGFPALQAIHLTGPAFPLSRFAVRLQEGL